MMESLTVKLEPDAIRIMSKPKFVFVCGEGGGQFNSMLQILFISFVVTGHVLG